MELEPKLELKLEPELKSEPAPVNKFPEPEPPQNRTTPKQRAERYFFLVASMATIDK